MPRPAFGFAVLIVTGTALNAQMPAPTNLKVLPRTLTRPEVTRIMRGFTQGLGVRCQHCHVGEGNDLSKFDFASDAKPTKETARKMLAMVMEINTTHLAGVGEPVIAAAPAAAPGTAPAPKVTCYTCHCGTTKPLIAAPPATPGIADPLMVAHRR